MMGFALHNPSYGLIANCDKAKGGLSTEPDGGVDCYVVGIHDQP